MHIRRNRFFLWSERGIADKKEKIADKNVRVAVKMLEIAARNPQMEKIPSFYEKEGILIVLTSSNLSVHQVKRQVQD
ncbi:MULTISPECIES: hypothetical protein [Lysinibacillus]|uniref:Uncharacterized protein n=1 Tax=Lysinibacillus xylanilyticus TaxID=582475 RepID=A0ABV3VWU1_9BACI